MATPAKTFTLLKGQEIAINLNEVYINDYEPIRDVYLNYGDNFVIGLFHVSGSTNLPDWATITQSTNVNTLDYPLSYTTALQPQNLYNGTDYVNQLKVKIDSAGTYYLPFESFFYKGFQTGGYSYTYTFIVNEPIPPQPAIPQGIQYNTYDRVIRVEKNVATNKSFGTDGLYPNGEEIIISSTLPAWITNNTINSRTQTWDITAPSVNTYYYYGNVYLRNEFKGSATITLQVVESLFEEVDNCCSDENINIVWLNRQGGRGNFIFTQRRDFKVNIGDKKTYITKDIKRYSEINKVYNAVTVYATGLSLNQIDFLDTLRYSIQAWVFINEVFIPIILDVESFDKYNTKENMYDISITFNYAEQLNIQRQ